MRAPRAARDAGCALAQFFTGVRSGGGRHKKDAKRARAVAGLGDGIASDDERAPAHFLSRREGVCKAGAGFPPS